MDPSEYRSFDALGLAELVREKQVAPGEVLEAALQVIAADNPRLNAVVHLDEAAARASIAAGVADGPFRGVPFLVKDLVTQVAGMATTYGSRLFADAPPDEHDSVIVSRHRRCGLVLLGKTNTPEFGLCPSTEPRLFGPTRNPHATDRSPGGSSGGAAAAVASGMVPVAHATDGGGSIRIPASCCGLFGLKPTRGRTTMAPAQSEGWAGMGTQHAVSRSVRDSAALLDATAGPAPGDPYWAPPPAGTWLSAAGCDPQPLRVGLCLAAPGGQPVDPQCAAAAEATARRLEALGHHVQVVEWPFPADLPAAAQSSIVGANVALTVDSRLAALGRPLGDDDLEPVTAAIVGWARQSSAVDYARSVGAMHRVGRLMGELLTGVDVVVTPTLGCLPPPLGTIDGSDLGRFVANVGPMSSFTAIANMSGQPAMSLPLDRSAEGLPVGTQVIGRYGDEETLFRLAGQLERAHPWAR